MLRLQNFLFHFLSLQVMRVMLCTQSLNFRDCPEYILKLHFDSSVLLVMPHCLRSTSLWVSGTYSLLCSSQAQHPGSTFDFTSKVQKDSNGGDDCVKRNTTWKLHLDLVMLFSDEEPPCCGIFESKTSCSTLPRAIFSRVAGNGKNLLWNRKEVEKEIHFNPIVRCWSAPYPVHVAGVWCSCPLTIFSDW